MVDSITDGFEDAPPDPCVARTIYVGTQGVNTVRLMHEAHDPTVRFLENKPTMRLGNAVRYLVNGTDTFRHYVEEIRACTGEGHYIYVMGWQLQIELELIPGDASSTMRALLSAAAANGVQVRALLWRNTIMSKKPGASTYTVPGASFSIPHTIYGQIFDAGNPWNLDEVREINGFTGDSCGIVDSRVPIAGSHHQKALIVNSPKGLVAMLGGIDIFENRFKQLYDVHCKIRGPSAFEVLRTFVERWKDHPDHASAEQQFADGKPLLGESTKVPPANGACTVQPARTYPTAPVYGFAPTGKIEAWLQLKAAIQRASKFIYMENQYFVSRDLAHELAAALPRLSHLTILLQVWSDMKGGLARTRRCLDILKAAPGSAEKLRVFCLPAQYVHTKTWIFDDELAIIGSANASRRSFTCDTELVAGITDHSNENKPAWRFARRLRARLWGHLLDMETPEGYAELADGVASAVHWLDPPATAKISAFEPMLASMLARANPKDSYLEQTGDFVWDNAIDPFTGQIGP
ncbi:MAG: hypothetical protein IAG13_26360 [Deltaproteobacteria bacterium]|nr:hypothetical protein [Nannocystaceae bacterium]